MTPMPNATTAIARIRNRISIPIDGDATRRATHGDFWV
jgi:hypothetical protein